MSIPYAGFKFQGSKLLKHPSPDKNIDSFDTYEIINFITSSLYGGIYSGRRLSDKEKVVIKHSDISQEFTIEDPIFETFITSKIWGINMTDESNKVNGDDYTMLQYEDSKTYPNKIEESNLIDEISGKKYIVELYDAKIIDKAHLQVYEFIEGRELFGVIIDNKGFKIEKVKLFTKQIALALKYLHDNGIAHGDISLENIIIDRLKLNVKLIDFGLSYYNRGIYPIIHDKRTCGKTGYVSKERKNNPNYSPFLDDVYSLGVVSFCMLFGVPPYNKIGDKFWKYIMKYGFNFIINKIHKSKVNSSDISLIDSFFSKLICTEEKRITINEVLSHDFLK